MDSSYTPASTIEKISMIKELKKICDDILNEYQEFTKLSQECWEISSLIPAKKQEILDLSAKNVEPFDDDAQKALYDLQHKNQVGFYAILFFFKNTPWVLRHRRFSY